MNKKSILEIADEVLALDEKATPDWTQADDSVMNLEMVCEGCVGTSQFRFEEDAKFIAASRNAAPELAQAVKEILAALEATAYDLERIRDADWTVEQMRLGAKSGAYLARAMLARFGCAESKPQKD